jgi:PilZ domain
MSKERRVAPRTICTLPVRFRVRTDIFAPAPQQRVYARGERAAAAFAPGVLDGETVNISAVGIYFKSREHVAFGEELEMFFRLPGELTGRTAEDVRCAARVVHVNASIDGKGTAGIGVAIGRFATGFS